MESTTFRQIRDGRQYDHLFPRAMGQDITVKENANVEDTLKLIQQKVQQDRLDTTKIAKMLKGDSLYETCENIWDFVYAHIKYKKDEKFIEQVRRPSRAWADRFTGVDCDCYSTFISSILLNLGISHKLRIAKYDGKDYYQHIYPIVPKDGNVHRALNNRKDYITMDCVKNAFDDEQAFTDFKDYTIITMRLDYLNGWEDESFGNQNMGSVDAQDLSSSVDDGELNGKFGNWLKKTAKKVGDKIGDGIRVINRFANPATILLRNGFLLAMKINMLKVASKLRYGYLTDEQAKGMNMDMDALNKVRSIKDKAETIYWQCGGLRENLKKAILEGKGNADRKVPLNGLDGLDAMYVDEDEYKILKYGNLSGIEDLDELGDPASGTALAAATGAVTALAAALKSIKGLFKKDTPEAAEFEETPPATDPMAPMPDFNMETIPAPVAPPPPPAQVPTIVNNRIDLSNQRLAPAPMQIPSYETETLPMAPPSFAPAVQQTVPTTTTTTPTTTTEAPKEEGFFTKTTNWVKANPWKSALIAVAVGGAGYLMFTKPKKAPPKNVSKKKKDNGVDGIPNKGKGKKKGKQQIKTIKF